MDAISLTAFGKILLGLFFTLIGLWSLVAAVFSIINYKRMRLWPNSTGKVISATPAGRFWITIQFSYAVDGATHESSQMITNDVWSRNLKTDDPIPLRYRTAPISKVAIDHSENVASTIRIVLYTAWVMVGSSFLYESATFFLANSPK